MSDQHTDLFQGTLPFIDFRLDAREEYIGRIASKTRILDVGGRNKRSRSSAELLRCSSNTQAEIVSTDIEPDYQPDLVDDITDSKIESASFDAVFCDSVLEHVSDYTAAIEHMYRILKPGGEIFIGVPFFFSFHDRKDYHRFTFSQVFEMLSAFEERKIFVPDQYGFGGVLWQTLWFYKPPRFEFLKKTFAFAANSLLRLPISFNYRAAEKNHSLAEYRYYYTHLYINRGFCGWARK